MSKETQHIPLRQSIPLDPKKVIKKTISSVLGLFVFVGFWAVFILAAIFSVLEQVGNFFVTAGLLIMLVFIVLVVIMYLYQQAYYNRYFYDAKDDFLIIKKGVIIPSETTLPFEKINDVYVDQDLLDRLFGLYDVHFSTATIQSGMMAHIDGLVKENAEKLRDIILKEIKKAVGKRNK